MLSRYSDEKLLSDQVFYLSFYIFIGLLPPLIGIFGHKAVQLPLFVISLLIIARFFVRKDCRNRMIGGLKNPGIIVLSLFLLLVLVHAINGTMFHPDRTRLLGKPAAIWAGLVVLLFVWTHRDILKRKLLLDTVLIGVLAGLVITILKILVARFYYGIEYRQDLGLISDFLNIDGKINDELKIISVFAFCVGLGFATKFKQISVFLGFWLLILIVSLFATGFTEYKDYALIKGDVFSETVLFGVPLSIIVLGLSYAAPKLMTNLLFAALSIVLMFSPWLFQLSYSITRSSWLPKPHDILVRGEIWDGVARKIMERPFFGFGLDSSRYLKNIDLKNDYMPTDNPWHPHNMFLQVWLDLGLIGVVIVVVLFYLSWRYVSAVKQSIRPSILAGITMLGVVALVSHSIWQTWSLALFTFFIVLASFHRPQPVKHT